MRKQPIMLSLRLLSFVLWFFILFDKAQSQSFDPFSEKSRCPVPCETDRSAWSHYSDLDQLTNCDATILFDLNLYNPVDRPNHHNTIRACSAQPSVPLQNRRQVFAVPSAASSPSNGTWTNKTESALIPNANHQVADLQILGWISNKTGDKDPATNIKTATQELAKLIGDDVRGETSVLLAKARNVIVGVYGGFQIEKDSLSRVVSQFGQLKAVSRASQTAAQLCSEHHINTQILGIFTDATGDLAAVQAALRGWSDAQCLDTLTSSSSDIWPNVTLSMVPGREISIVTDEAGEDVPVVENATAALNKRAVCSKYTTVKEKEGCWDVAKRCGITEAKLVEYSKRSKLCSTIQPREVLCCSSGDVPDLSPAPKSDGSCAKYTKIVAGDGCNVISARCGISDTKLAEYNKVPTLCTDTTKIQLGKHLCCSKGNLPDLSPKPNSDGTCKSWTLTATDLCIDLANANNMTPADIEARNQNTWGWLGCKYLQVGMRICLSFGTPHMPKAITNAVCGPQKPNTPKPSDMSKLAQLNPCPLNACCNVWGQCGLTKDFCTVAPLPGGAPGTVKPGSNGCLNNCGMEVVNKKKPSQYIRIGYYEAWNAGRPCLHMRPRHINTHFYTHVHFAFGGITPEFVPNVKGMETEYAEFRALKNVKRIISFGGWSFSTEVDTAPIFRKGVTDGQRQTFAKNVANMVINDGLDGVDFDWEYPGAPDIPGIPPGDPEDGKRYLEFVKLVRSLLPTKYSIGIAAPASYWYLKGFPIKEMAQVVNYIVYMTYDLHGQWDWGNQWSVEGCPAGNCVRSHVNYTETLNALVMITKAGVTTDKVIMGMPLYGRSFKLTNPGCFGPMCTFVGKNSTAARGRCTGERGYISNFEIREIIASNNNVKQYSDKDGDYIIYNGDEYVSYMSRSLYGSRDILYKETFLTGGTSDWAVDLDADYFDWAAEGGDGNSNGGKTDIDDGSGVIPIHPSIYSSASPTVYCQIPCTLALPPWVLSTATTISMPPVTVTYEENWITTITVVVSGKTSTMTKSVGQITSTTITVPAITTKTISVWNIVISSEIPTDSSGRRTIRPTSSIRFPDITRSHTYIDGDDDDSKTTIFPITIKLGPYPTITPTKQNPQDPSETPKPPPPPPPPPNFPSAITIIPGPPKPTCNPGTAGCPTPCTRDCNPRSYGCDPLLPFLPCGCIGPFCPPQFGGSCLLGGCYSIIDPPASNPNKPPPPTTTCRRPQTASCCSVDCTVHRYPSTTTTTCNKPTCTQTLTACTITGSTTRTTTTKSCRPTQDNNNMIFHDYFPDAEKNPNQLVPQMGKSDSNVAIFNRGSWDFEYLLPLSSEPDTTTSKTKTWTSPSTLPTTPPDPAPLCFKDLGPKKGFRRFTKAEYEEVVTPLCSVTDYLVPDFKLRYAWTNPSTKLTAYIKWADDQSGCSAPKKNAKIAKDGDCKALFYQVQLRCDVEDEESPGAGFGFAFVENNPDWGCVEYWLGTEDV